MDKSWMYYDRSDDRYIQGIYEFMNFVYKNANGKTLFYCPCKVCHNNGDQISIHDMYGHLARRGMMTNYTIWDKHGEVSNEPIMVEFRRQYLSQRTSSTSGVEPSMNPTMEILHDTFPYYAGYDANTCGDTLDDDGLTFNDVVDDDYEKYDRLLHESQTPLYPYSKEGSQAPFVAAFLEAYEPDRNAKVVLEKVKRKLVEVIETQADGSAESIPIDDQVAVIEEGMGRKKGTSIRGVGAAIRRDPKRRGGARQNIVDTQAEDRIQKIMEEARLAKEEAQLAKEEAQRAKEEAERSKEEFQRQHMDVMNRLLALEAAAAPKQVQPSGSST